MEDSNPMASVMEGLDSDLISGILIKLDLKTLSRCRCVCRAWNRAISSAAFMKAHRRRSISRGLSDLLFINLGFKKPVSDNDDGSQLQWYSAFTMIGREKIDREAAIAEDVIRTNTVSFEASRIAESPIFPLPITCDLLCFNKMDDIALCNPRTAQVQNVPRPDIDPWFGWFQIAFGYVASWRQYALVGLYYSDEKFRASKFCFSSGDDEWDNADTAESSKRIIFSSSSWKEIQADCPLSPNFNWSREEGILIKNSVYWRTCLGWNINGWIISLDLDSDKFRIIRCPPMIFYDCPEEVNMIDLKGTLSLAGVRDLRCPSLIDIWVFDDQANSSSYSCSWVRKYCINMESVSRELPANPFICPKSSREGEVIVRSAIHGRHYICNPENGSIRTVINHCPMELVGSRFEEVGFFWESSSHLALTVPNMEEDSLIKMPPFLSI